MKLNKLTTANTKGSDIDLELTGRDLFVGPNGSGKSTHLETAVAGILGYLPRIGKTLGDTLKLSSDSSMQIALETDGGFKVSRTFLEKRNVKRSGDVSFTNTQKITIIPKEEKETERAKASRVEKTLGHLPILFDLSQFVGMSDSEKRSFVFGLMQIDGWDKEKVRSVLESAVEDMQSDQDVSADITEIMSVWSAESTVQSNIAAILAAAKDLRSESNASRKKKTGALQHLMEEKQKLGSDESVQTSVLRKELEETQKKLGELNAQQAADNERRSRQEKIEKRILEIQNGIPTAEKVIQGYRDALKEHESKVKELGVAKECAEEETKRLWEEFSKEPEEEPEPEVAEGPNQIHIMDRIAEIFMNWLSENNMTLEGDDSFIVENCAKDLAEKIIDHGPIRKLLKGMVIQLEQKKVDSGPTEAQRERAELKKAYVDANKEFGDLKDLVGQTEAAIIKRKGDIEAIEERLKSGKAELDSLQKESNEIPATYASDQVDIMISSTETKARETSDRIRRQEEIADLIKQFDSAKIASTEEEDRYEILNLMCIRLGPQGLQGDIIRELVKPLATRVNGLLQDLNPKYSLEFNLLDKNGKEIFEMGWKQGKKLIPFQSLSGGEQVIFASALATGIILEADPPLKILCIEAAELDASNASSLLRALDAFAGDLDNILVATCNDIEETPATWQVNSLAKKKEEVGVPA